MNFIACMINSAHSLYSQQINCSDTSCFYVNLTIFPYSFPKMLLVNQQHSISMIRAILIDKIAVNCQNFKNK